MRIYLLGFMGSGKTYLGKQLAQELNCKFIDTDDVIVEKAQKSIPDIFKEDGEDVFRKLEQDVLKNISQKFSGTIATGGGMPCFSDNMEIINNTGTSIYLRLSPQCLVKRLENIKDSRPLLKSKNNEELYNFTKDTLKKREPYYKKADHIINGENANVNDLLLLLSKT